MKNLSTNPFHASYLLCLLDVRFKVCLTEHVVLKISACLCGVFYSAGIRTCLFCGPLTFPPPVLLGGCQYIMLFIKTTLVAWCLQRNTIPNVPDQNSLRMNMRHFLMSWKQIIGMTGLETFTKPLILSSCSVENWSPGCGSMWLETALTVTNRCTCVELCKTSKSLVFCMIDWWPS